MALLIGFGVGVLSVIYRGPSTYVRFSVPVQDLGDVCANARVRQQNEMIVNGPAYIQLAATIYDAVSNVAYYPLTESYVLAVAGEAEPIIVRDIFTWIAPSLPPSKYKRVLAAATYRNQEPVTTVTTFNLVLCSEDGRP